MIFNWTQSIKFRFLVAIVAMVLPLLILGVTTYVSINRVVDAFNHVVEDPYTELREVARLQVAVSAALMPPNDYLVHGDKSERKNFEQQAAEVDLQFDRINAILGSGHEESGFIRSAHQKWLAGKKQAQAVLLMPRPVGSPQAALAMERMDIQFEKVLSELEAANQLSTQEATEALATAKMVRNDAVMKAVLSVIVGVMVAIVVGWLLMQNTVTPIQELHRAVQQFGRGNLGERADVFSRDEVGKLASAFNDMASQVQSMTETLTDESIHDPLTGAINRREFERQFQKMLQHSIRHNRPLTVAMLDLDHFKGVNDTHGHQVGDELLKTFCSVVEGNLRPGDVFARYGGEEFIAVLPESDAMGARRVAERLRLLAGGSGVKRNGKMVSTTVSIGLATFPADGSTVDQLLAAADRALYGAKAAGRDRVEVAQEI